MILSPIGHPFCLPDEKETDGESSHSQCTQSHILQLVDVIKTIHGRGLIHRDLKTGNIFALENDVVLVSDVGSAIPCNTAASFAGTLHYASNSALQAEVTSAAHIWTSSDDLESLVKFSFILFSNATFTTNSSAASLPLLFLQFWTETLPKVWQEATAIAHEADRDLDCYDKLKLSFSSLISPVSSASSVAASPAVSASASASACVFAGAAASPSS